MRSALIAAVAMVWATGAATLVPSQTAGAPFLTSEILFPLEHWHNHASMVVELPNGDLLACWFHGSGERTADDVKILGARLKKGADRWTAPFEMADTPGYPDTNATMFLDPQKRLWLLWPTILANEWHTALMKYKISTDYDGAAAPKWAANDVLHVTPGDLRPAAIDTYDDHRMAMRFAITGLRVPGVTINDPQCVSKTFPDFFERWGRLG